MASGLLAFSACAHANAGIGYFMLVLPPMVVSLIAVIPLEGAVFRAMLHSPLGNAMRLSMRANFASTLIGVVFGIAIDVVLFSLSGSAGPNPSRESALVMLIPMFGLSWWVEYRSVARNAPEFDRRPVAMATGAANALTYALMSVLIWLTYQPHARALDRVYISEGILAAGGLRMQVTEDWHNRKVFPVDVSPVEGKLYRVTVEKEGRIAVRFTGPPESPMENKTLYLVPSIDGSELRWLCGSNEIHPRYLPGSCRDKIP